MPFPKRKHAGEYPPEIQQLITQCGTVAAAERRAGISASTFSKIRAGSIGFSQHYRARVAAALNPTGETAMPANTKPLTVPDTCPPLLANLIRAKGTKSAAIKALGTHDSTFYAVLGGRTMPVEWIARIKDQLGQPAIGAPRGVEAPAAPPIPPFVPWDGKTVGVFHVKAHGKRKARTIKNVPQPMLDFLGKYDTMSSASRVIGLSGGSLLPWIEGGRKFTEERQRRIHAATHGAQQALVDDAADFDKCTLGQAIVLLGAPSYDRIQDLAEVMNGRLLFKMNTGVGWLVIYKMAADDLPRFKRLAMRDAKRIVCP